MASKSHVHSGRPWCPHAGMHGKPGELAEKPGSVRVPAPPHSKPSGPSCTLGPGQAPRMRQCHAGPTQVISDPGWPRPTPRPSWAPSSIAWGPQVHSKDPTLPSEDTGPGVLAGQEEGDDGPPETRGKPGPHRAGRAGGAPEWQVSWPREAGFYPSMYAHVCTRTCTCVLTPGQACCWAGGWEESGQPRAPRRGGPKGRRHPLLAGLCLLHHLRPGEGVESLRGSNPPNPALGSLHLVDVQPTH